MKLEASHRPQGDERGRLRSGSPVRQRLAPALTWFFFLWPSLMVLAAAWTLGEQPLTASLKWGVRITGATAATAYLAAEVSVCALLLFIGDLLLWASLDSKKYGRLSRLQAWAEPPLFALFIITGIVLVHPAVLWHPLFTALRPLPVWMALSLLLCLVALSAGIYGYRRSGARTGALVTSLVALLLTFGTTLLAAFPPRVGGEAMKGSILLLGLDSVSQNQDLSILNTMTASPPWTSYSHPVTPGLLTNSVWPAIIMNRYVHETGCYMTFQDPNWDRSAYHMVRAAESSGYETWSFFSDQFTTYVGSNAGFEIDRSGPKGWLQPTTAAVKDAGLFLPLMLPRLPSLPFFRSPRNQSGTWAYDLRRELEEIVRAGGGERKVFVAAHLDYLHQPAYPSLVDLSREEIRRVLRARVESISDLSLHWQYPEVEGEPIGIYGWKLRNLQRVVVEVFAASGVAGPDRQNRIAIFADHGPRLGISTENFSAEHLYHVPLSTAGVPVEQPSAAPISLLDLHRLIGLRDQSRPGSAVPVVEYTNIESFDEELVVMKSSDLQRNGEVALNPYIIARFGQRLLAYSPYEAERGFVSVPAVPGEMDGIEPPSAANPSP